MSRELEGKIALVTGAGRGIGRSISELLAGRGATVVLVARTKSELDSVATCIRGDGGQAFVMAGDLTSQEFVDSLFEMVRERFGHLDILINNAGIAPGGPIEELSVADFRRCLEVNLVAAYACMQHALRLMRDHGGTGKIVNIGSVRSHWTEVGDAGAYNASKQGLKALTESVARQLHGQGLKIAVSLICPGVVDTTLTNRSRQPRPEWLSPETVAEAVLYAVEARDGVNVFDVTVFPTSQKPW